MDTTQEPTVVGESQLVSRTAPGLTRLVWMHVHVAAAGARRDDAQHLVWLGVLANEILGEVHSQLSEFCEVGNLLLLDLALGLGGGRRGGLRAAGREKRGSHTATAEFGQHTATSAIFSLFSLSSFSSCFCSSSFN